MLDGFEFPLACQSVPMLSKRMGIECDLTEEIFPVNLERDGLDLLNRKREVALELLRQRGVTLWNVFDGSGIGEERSALAQEFTRGVPTVLEIASGRGYFTFASAREGSEVIAVDPMDGQERTGWWKVFTETSKRLGLADRVAGMRSDGSFLALGQNGLGAVTCVHALRNILSPVSRRRIIEEMARVVSPYGKLVVVESSLEAESPKEEVYLEYLKLRTWIGWEAMPPSKAELEKLMSEIGFNLTFEVRKFDRDYAPLEFPSFIIRDETQRIREEHARIEKLRSEHGIKPTAAMVALAQPKAR